MELGLCIYDVLALWFIIWMSKSIKMSALKTNGNRHFFQMKKIFKVIVGCVIVILTLKACRLNYVCDVVDSIPKEIRERIITEHPECANIDLLVKFWETKGDSLVSEIVQEQIYDCELTEYLKLHPEENN